MAKTILIVTLLISFLFSYSQQGFLAVKKHGRTIQRFPVGSSITFNFRDHGWMSGDVIRIGADSLYIQQRSVRMDMTGFDTVHFGMMRVALTDIVAMPRKAAMIYYKNDQPKLIPGHEKFLYIKNGYMFRILGGGYTALNIANNVLDHDPPFAKDNLEHLLPWMLIFSIGEVLHFTYHPYLRLGKKYRLKPVVL